MKLKQRFKQFGLKAFGADVSELMLMKINNYALKDLTPDDVYVRKFLMAHNAIDRDNERFPEALLDQFKETLPGKGFLIGHQRSGPGKGLFFDSETEEMTPEQFKDLTDEEPRLPEGMEMVKVLWGWVYMLSDSFNEETIKNIDAGIHRHVSIGFRASDIVAVKDNPNGSVKYWEYVPPGEATEGSTVWLGAQPGATAQKAADHEDHDDNTTFPHRRESEEQGGKGMKEFIQRLSKKLGKVFSEDNAVDEITAHIDETVAQVRNEKAEEIKTLKEEVSEQETKIKELAPLADEGKAYRKDLVDNYVTLRTKLEEIPSDSEEKQKQARTVAEGFPVEFLKSEVDALRKRVDDKFPAEPQLKGGDTEREEGGEKKPSLIPEDE